MPASPPNLGSMTFMELTKILDRMEPAVRASCLEAAETWHRGGGAAILEQGAGRAALGAKGLGDQIVEDPTKASDKLQMFYFRTVRQLENYARFQIDVETARARGALPIGGPEGMAMPGDDDDDESNPHEPRKGVTHDD